MAPTPTGETWNVMKIGFQLKQVRERLAKGLVDKGVLRTEKRNFLLFDMATHPVADVRTKDAIISRVISLLTSTTSAVPPSAMEKEGTQARCMRAVALASAAYAASVLDNAFVRLTYEEREAATVRYGNQNVNVAEQLIEKGLAGAVRHKRDDEDRSPDYDKLMAAEQA